MAHIKKVVMQGFKSFAKRTEVVFDKGINIIIGPNGGGKSNVADSICFALGRLSVKSMRAEKSRNLIFMGSKYVKPAHEARVELIFDNLDRAFAIDRDEIIVERAVRANGQGIYKINGETKTRAEIIETLAQGGIDPYGFNIILQGQIQSIVRMHPEDRGKIIGEVAGISVYEWRKEKSLKELEKTDERLKEINIILRQRMAYLANLEKERAQAQKYKDLQLMTRRIKATITKKKLDEKKKEIDSIVKAIGEKINLRDKEQEKAIKIQGQIDILSGKINEINKHIREATGVEQGRLREEITNLRAELEGLKVRREGYENRKAEVERRISEMKKSIPEAESEIAKLREETPLMAQKSKELKKKKDELGRLETERKKLIALKTELNTLRDRSEDKKRQLARTTGESEAIIKQLEEMSAQLSHNNEKECQEEIERLKKHLHEDKNKNEDLRKNELANEKIIFISESEIKRNEEIKGKVEKIDICPLCKSKITEEHIEHVFRDCDEKILKSRDNFEKAKNNLELLKEEKERILKKINEFDDKIRSNERELFVHKSINEKKKLLEDSVNYERLLKKEIEEMSQRRISLERKTEELSDFDEKYRDKILEIEEISSRTEEDIDTTLLYKERELERTVSVIMRSQEDLEEIENKIEEISGEIEEKQGFLDGGEEKEEELNKRFNKMFSDRDKIQKEIQELSIKLSEMQSEIRQIEEQANYLKVGKARVDSEYQTLEMDIGDYVGIEIVQGSLQSLEERLVKTQENLQSIGAINLRALEVYDEVKKEYDGVKEKTDVLEKEKLEILKIIEEIDKKKKKTFMRAFNAVNTLFSENFAKLSAKGLAYLEIENQEDIFAGGINIVVKMAKGKYFDVTSLSGGEQTLVALSLLFAIQEYRPYQFYILDEIDAALDKRNSERLAALLNQYMKSGQYIVVTHNDAVIVNSNVLYGVSMHEGVSKVLSLEVGSIKPEQLAEMKEDKNLVEGAKDELRQEDKLLENETQKLLADNSGEKVGEV
ncbi:chromosome segregation protein SMC [Candidatus Pacearchaeota archaeon]|nr:chromosome segregation protein SMC [Candidatus Pacearchaeota archaeon]